MLKHRVIIAVFILLAVLAGCGGGSTGTDGGVSIRVVGTVKNSDGKSLPGVSITIKENGDQATTDSNGRYQVDTTVTPGPVELIISADNKEAQASFDATDAKADQTIAVDLTLDEAEFAVTVASVSVVPDPQPTPQPSARPTPVADNSYQILGALRTGSGAGVPGFAVKVRGANQVTKTDKKGGFSIKTEDRTPQLLISNKKHSVLVSLGTIPRGAHLVKVSLIVTIPGQSGGGTVTPQAADAPFKVKAKITTVR